MVSYCKGQSVRIDAYGYAAVSTSLVQEEQHTAGNTQSAKCIRLVHQADNCSAYHDAHSCDLACSIALV